jgi:hypothetical protein
MGKTKSKTATGMVLKDSVNPQKGQPPRAVVKAMPVVA